MIPFDVPPETVERLAAHWFQPDDGDGTAWESASESARETCRNWARAMLYLPEVQRMITLAQAAAFDAYAESLGDAHLLADTDPTDFPVYLRNRAWRIRETGLP